MASTLKEDYLVYISQGFAFFLSLVLLSFIYRFFIHDFLFNHLIK